MKGPRGDAAAAKRTKRKTTWLDAFTQKKTATKLVKKAQDEAASGENLMALKVCLFILE